LRAALSDGYWQVQKEAIAALGRLRAAAAASDLLRFLEHEMSDMRRAAAYALGDIGATQAIPALRALAADPDIEVRKAATRAVEALQRIEASEATAAPHPEKPLPAQLGNDAVKRSTHQV
jgi:HEAT repeat protein